MRRQSYPVGITSVVALLMLVALPACASNNQANPTAISATVTPRATTAASSGLRPLVPADALRGVGIRIWHPWLGVEASLLESDVAEFNQVNEWGITVRATAYSGLAELHRNLSGALGASEGPDLAIALPEHLIEWQTGNYVVDLGSYAEDTVYGMSGAERGDFPAVFWNQDVVGGTRLGVPAQRTARFLAYNTTWARALGFEDAPSTEQQFREQACAAHAALLRDEDATNDGRGGWIVDTHPMTMLPWMISFGGGVLDGEGYRFLSPKNLEAVAFLKQLYDDSCAWLPGTSDETPAAFAAREGLFAAASLDNLSEFGRALAAADNPDEWTVLTFPGPEQPGLVVYGSSFVVFKGAPEQQLASWLFIRWLLSPEKQKEWVEATGLLPLRSSMIDLLASYSRSHPQWTTAVELLPRAQMQPQLASWRTVRVMLGDGFEAMFRSNTPAGRVAEILAIMDRTASDLAQ